MQTTGKIIMVTRSRRYPSIRSNAISILQIVLICSLPTTVFGNVIRHNKRHNKKINNPLCKDLRSNCKELVNNKNDDICEESQWIQSHCPVSCNRCTDIIYQVPIIESFNSVLRKSYSIIQDSWGYDLGIPQIITEEKILEYTTYTDGISTSYDYNITTLYNEMNDLLSEARNYLKNEVYATATNDNNDKYKLVRDKCKNYNELCLEWSLNGDCDNEPNFMSKECSPICNTCDQLHIEAKCPLPHINDVINAWKPGDLNKMFERIISDPTITSQYPVQILSRPTSTTDELQQQIDDDETIETNDNNTTTKVNNKSKSKSQSQSVSSIPDGPWVIVLENFINETEALRLIELGTEIGYKRSKDLGPINKDTGEYSSSISKRRTSTNAWCNENECQNDAVVKNFFTKLQTITQIPKINSEAIQLLRYEYGQYYNYHHDYIQQDYDRVQGVRILTVYLYLNTIHEGGGTSFIDLNITVKPIQGNALIWPSVYDDQPHIKDYRTRHSALSVDGINEVKYGANVWLHQREFFPECS